MAAACSKVIPSGLCARGSLRAHRHIPKRAETAHAQIAVNLVTRLKRFDISAHGFNMPSDVTANDLHLRPEETVQHANDELRALEQRPVPIIDRRGMHANQDFTGLGRGPCHVPQFQDVGRPVAVHDDCLHACAPMLVDLSDRPDAAHTARGTPTMQSGITLRFSGGA